MEIKQKNYICFDEWEKTDAFTEPSGRSEKHWLVYPNSSQIGLFKYPKVDQYENINSFEHISEDLASELAKSVGVPCCYVDIGTYHGRIGCMSYLINDESEMLWDGVNCLMLKYPNYDPDYLIDPDTHAIYSLEMIEKSLSGLRLWDAFLKIPIFDFFIGNSDRHQSNWAIIVNRKNVKVQLSPIYDNGSSLCALIKEQDIENLFRDSRRMNATIHTKSRSRIGLINNPHPLHDEVIEYIRSNYYNETIQYVNKYLLFTDEKIMSILSLYDEVLTPSRKQLLYLYLTEKRRHLLDVYNL